VFVKSNGMKVRGKACTPRESTCYYDILAVLVLPVDRFSKTK
jgi:hypothetical protein